MTSMPDPQFPGCPVATVFGHRMVLNPPHRDRFITPSSVRDGCFEPPTAAAIVFPRVPNAAPC